MHTPPGARTRGMHAASRVVLAVLLAGCAALPPRPAPLTRDGLVALARSGASAQTIIERLITTETVFFLTASEIVALHREGVPAAALDHLQRAQIEEIRRRDLFTYSLPPLGGLFPCPWPRGTRHPAYGYWPWGCF